MFDQMFPGGGRDNDIPIGISPVVVKNKLEKILLDKQEKGLDFKQFICPPVVKVRDKDKEILKSIMREIVEDLKASPSDIKEEDIILAMKEILKK